MTIDPELHVGFLGAGLMGEPMAANLLASHVELRLWNRSTPALERLAAQGARVAATVRDLLLEMGHINSADELDEHAPLKALGMDSLSLLEFLMLLEERTGVEITTDQVELETPLSELLALAAQKPAG